MPPAGRGRPPDHGTPETVEVQGGSGRVPGAYGLAPSNVNGNKVTVDCTLEPAAWPIQGIGYSNDGGPPQEKDWDKCETGPITEWGACCLSDRTCRDVGSFDECDALGGTHQGPYTECHQLACCLPDGSCIMTDINCGECEAAGGVLQGGGSTCATIVCQPVSIEPGSRGRVKAGYRR